MVLPIGPRGNNLCFKGLTPGSRKVATSRDCEFAPVNSSSAIRGIVPGSYAGSDDEEARKPAKRLEIESLEARRGE
jgi:hypothetical protein